MSLRHTLFALSAVALATALVACNNDELPDPNAEPTGPVATGDTVAITSAGNVISFDRAPSAALTSNLTIKGLASGESLVGIDYRPATRVLYALSNQGNLYLLDPSTGNLSMKVALASNPMTPINPTACMPAVTAFTALSGTEFGMDFNPAVDRLRVVSDTGQNLRINVDNGLVTVDCGLVAGGATSQATGAAYDNSVQGVGPQTPPQEVELYYIDASTDQLLETEAPNNGMLTVVGALGVDATAVSGFDVASSVSGTTVTDVAYATLTVGGMNGFYRINLDTGAATLLANFSSTGGLRGLSLK